MSSQTQWASEADWELHRATILRLSTEEEKTPKQLMSIMRRRHDFHATIKMYQDHLDAWQLGPKEHAAVASGSGSATAGASGSAPGGVKKWAAPDDWEQHRALITQLYDEEGKTLAQVTDIMEREHGFHATVKMYKTRFKKWGLWKNTRATDVTDIILQRTGAVDTSQDGSQVTVNGRQMDRRKVDAYIRRRRKQVIARLGDGPDALAPVIISPMPRTQSMGSPAAYRTEEFLYRAVKDYFSNRLASGRWTWVSPTKTEPGTKRQVAAYQRQSAFFERFRVAIPMIQDPANRGAEGIKLLRICFAEVGKLLEAEDPMLLFGILSIVNMLWRFGDKMHFLQVQLLRHLSALSVAMKHPTADIWRAMYESVSAGTMNNHRSLQACNVVVNQLDEALGLWHAKTTEWSVISMTFNDDLAAKEDRFRGMLSGLDALGTFDQRHMGLRMNLAAFYYRYERYERSAEVILEILDDPSRLAHVRQQPGIAYKLFWRIGQIRGFQGDYPAAERYLADALRIARTHAVDGPSGNAMLLECLVAVERCFRDQGKTAEADAAVAEREGIVRATLESVGEKENSVAPIVPGAKAS